MTGISTHKADRSNTSVTTRQSTLASVPLPAARQGDVERPNANTGGASADGDKLETRSSSGHPPKRLHFNQADLQAAPFDTENNATAKTAPSDDFRRRLRTMNAYKQGDRSTEHPRGRAPDLTSQDLREMFPHIRQNPGSESTLR